MLPYEIIDVLQNALVENMVENYISAGRCFPIINNRLLVYIGVFSNLVLSITTVYNL